MSTIRDVAKKAGVSVGTVSRAFNNYKDINPETKRRIFAIAEELNYSPNIVAKSLSSKKKMGIGIILEGLIDGDGKDNITFSILQGAYRVAATHKVELSLYAINREIQAQTSLKRFCSERNLAGIIVQGVTTDDIFFEELEHIEIPCVVIDVIGKAGSFCGVMSDNVSAAYEVATYVLNSGHQNPYIIAGSKNAMVTVERTAGFFEAFKDYGKYLTREHIIYADYQEEIAYQKVTELLQKEKPTALICMSDLMALGAMRAIKDCGFSIPKDISVTGFDGIILTDYTQPQLTTVKQDFSLISEEAAKTLLELIAGNEVSSTKFIPHKLLIRESVKKVRKK
jgi:Transcriptional regulators